MEVVLSQFIGYKVKAADGHLGTVCDFYFDESSWKVGFVAINAEKWLERDLLISPHDMLLPDITSKTFPVKITRQQISSRITMPLQSTINQTVDVHLNDTLTYAQERSAIVMPIPAKENPQKSLTLSGHTLRRTQVVAGYVIRSLDTVLGKIFDYILEDTTWQIRYVVIRIEKSISKKHLLMDSRHLNKTGWSNGTVELNL